MGEIFEGQSVDKEVILVSLKNLIDTCCVVAMSCLTFCYPMGFRRQDYWSGLPFPPPGNLPHPEIKSASPPLLLCSHSVISNSLKPHGLQHSRLPCALPSPGVCSNSRPLSQLMPSNHLILCHLLLLLPLIFPSIMVFSKDSALHIRWPKYWSFSFNTSPSNEYSGLISFRIDWFDFLAIQGTLKSLLQHQSRWILYCWDTREALSTLKALSSMLAYLYLQFSTPFRDSLIAQLVKNLPSMRRPWFDSWVGKIPWRRDRLPTPVFLGFPCGSAGKESACNRGHLGSIPALGKSPGEGKGYPLQYSGLENSVHGVSKSQTHNWAISLSL